MRFPSPRKALADRAAARAPKEKPLKPEKPKKENTKRGGSQPTAKPKPPAQQQTVVRGITYYKAGQAEEAQGAAGSRGECRAVLWGGGRGLSLPAHRAPPVSPQRALPGGRLCPSGRRRGTPRPPQPRAPRPVPVHGQRPPCPAPRLRPAPP